jgi:prepilin-type processing-associated H-X9-DG protein
LDWTADPNRGYGPDQPGSWAYNILAYLEEASLHDLGKGQAVTSADFMKASMAYHQTAPSVFNCPSRRVARPYRAAWLTVREQTWIPNLAQTSGVAKSDYASNSGDSVEYSGDNMARPTSYAAAATLNWTPTQYCDPTARTEPARSNFIHCQTGIMYYRSKLKPARIEDGTSNTYLVGEKYLHPEAYDCDVVTGAGCTYGDNQSLYTGYEWDNHRVAYNSRSGIAVDFFQPAQDTGGVENRYAFGSAHTGGLNMAFCDGSVQTISYDVNSTTHSRLANRFDGEVVEKSGL